MIRTIAFALLLFCLLSLPGGAAFGSDDPVHPAILTAAPSDFRCAIVRIISHGITGAVIESRQDYSLILSCGHGFRQGGQDLRSRPIALDFPQADGCVMPPARGKPRLVACDFAADLSLILLPAGPLPSVPLAGKGPTPGRKCWSCGYDEMRWADGPLVAAADVIRDDGRIITTRQIPWHGRSGGPLIDCHALELVGVVQGYEQTMSGYGPGRYVNGSTIRRFVAQWSAGGTQDQDRRLLPFAPPIAPSPAKPGRPDCPT